MSLKDKYQNGKIPNSALKKLDTGQYLEKNAANAFMKMKAEAKKQGVNIKLTGRRFFAQTLRYWFYSMVCVGKI